MRFRGLRMVVIVALVLVAGSCGGSDDGAGDGGDDGGASATTTTTANAPTTVADDGGATPSETTAPASEGETTDPPEVTEMGSFTVNDSEFAVTFLNRCVPFEGEGSDVIDLQPIAQAQGAQLNLNGTNDFVDVSVQGSAVSQMFGSLSFEASSFDDGDVEWSIDGDRWTGSGTLFDVFEEAEPVTITWDVMIPDEIRDC